MVQSVRVTVYTRSLMKRLNRFHLLALAACLFCFAAGWRAHEVAHPRRLTPGDVAGALPDCRRVPPAPESTGMYLTSTAKGRDDLVELTTGDWSAWRGTVYVERDYGVGVGTDRDPEHYLRLPGVTAWGDPELLRVVADRLR